MMEAEPLSPERKKVIADALEGIHPMGREEVKAELDRLGKAPPKPKRRRNGKSHVAALQSFRASYCSDEDIGRAIRRGFRWLNANPSKRPEDAPRHIQEKLGLAALVFSG